MRVGFMGFDSNWQWHDDGFRWVVPPDSWTTITWDLADPGDYEEVGLKLPPACQPGLPRLVRDRPVSALELLLAHRLDPAHRAGDLLDRADAVRLGGRGQARPQSGPARASSRRRRASPSCCRRATKKRSSSDTIQRVVELNYPRDLVQVLVVIEAGDRGTIAHVEHKLARAAERGHRARAPGHLRRPADQQAARAECRAGAGHGRRRHDLRRRGRAAPGHPAGGQHHHACAKARRSSSAASSS